MSCSSYADSKHDYLQEKRWNEEEEEAEGQEEQKLRWAEEAKEEELRWGKEEDDDAEDAEVEARSYYGYDSAGEDGKEENDVFLESRLAFHKSWLKHHQKMLDHKVKMLVHFLSRNNAEDALRYQTIEIPQSTKDIKRSAFKVAEYKHKLIDLERNK
jgi:hypothetical protein